MVLTKLADDSESRIRARVAEHPETPQEVLLRLAGDDHPDVRLAVSEKKSLKHRHWLLERLAKDPSEDVRLGHRKQSKNSFRNSCLASRMTKNMFVQSNAKKTLSELSSTAK